jgi:hypothetical protein
VSLPKLRQNSLGSLGQSSGEIKIVRREQTTKQSRLRQSSLVPLEQSSSEIKIGRSEPTNILFCWASHLCLYRSFSRIAWEKGTKHEAVKIGKLIFDFSIILLNPEK